MIYFIYILMKQRINLVERHIIKSNHSFYKECEYLCKLSKNLYNKSLYETRQKYFLDKCFKNYIDNYYDLRTSKEYRKLPDKVSKQTLKLVEQNFKSFFKSVKDFSINPSKYKKRPSIPKYLDSDNGKYVTVYEKDAISLKELKKGNIKLSKTNILIKTLKANPTNIVQTRIVPKLNYYVIEVIYKDLTELKEDNGNHASIDFGLTNIISLVYNTGDNPILFIGDNIKKINEYYNYKISKIKSELKIKNKKDSSKRLRMFYNKRDFVINTLLHKMSRELVNQIADKNITTLIVGRNKRWKQDINLGKKSNREFVSIPFFKLLNMLKYKCLLKGINLIETEESYTSKCSFIDNESVEFHNHYLGKRINRNEFVTSDGELINADVNAAYNIMRKVVKSFRFHVGLAVNPEMILI